ncbi:hypothetical protein [Scatolibacter rhodanostii]|uniref:hypothetical protein n=1 Tax=Scatolibacter rhodanostii TaxID=2014781 RepID=UPI000C07F2E5|nr:hypothetical protein [Scatolibacter rhodanostii]
MDDISGRLSEILSDPQSMQQIQSLMSSLGQSGATAADQPAGEGSYTGTSGGMPDMSVLSSLLSSMNGQQANALPGVASQTGDAGMADASQMMATVSQLAPLMQKMREDDDSSRLLRSLRPLLSADRQQKLDESLKIMQLMRLMPMMKNSGFLSGLL